MLFFISNAWLPVYGSLADNGPQSPSELGPSVDLAVRRAHSG